MEEYKDILETIISYIELIHNEYEFHDNQKDELTKAKEDIRHIKELGNLDAIELMLLTSKERKILRERRKSLDNSKILRVLMDVLDEDLLNKLEGVLKQINYKINELSDRKYYAKSKTGQKLIDKYSKDNDDLVTSDVNLGKLKHSLEEKNAS